MSAPQFALLGTRRFAPLFATQFLGAFNDNLYRSAMLFLVAFTILAGNPDRAALVAVIAGGIFILPYFLFSSLAGQLADRIDKARLARIVKIAEVAIMLAGAVALTSASLPAMLIVLFAMGVHSTFFGPVKYSMLPQHLAPDELMGGTGLVEAGTFLAILLGQIAGGLLGAGRAAIAVLAVAGLGVAVSLFIPKAPPAADRPALDLNLARGTARILRQSHATRPLFLSILGISWFFALGAVLTQQFVPLVERLNADETVASLFLGLFSVGVAVGSLVVGRLLRGEISARYVPAAALVLALGVIDLSFASRGVAPAAVRTGIAGFVARPGSWRLIADLLVIAVASGVYIVPLYALLQTLGDAAGRSRDIAANNVVNAVAMVIVSALVAVLLASGAPIEAIFLMLGLCGLVVALFACAFLPETALASFVWRVLRLS